MVLMHFGKFDNHTTMNIYYSHQSNEEQKMLRGALPFEINFVITAQNNKIEDFCYISNGKS